MEQLARERPVLASRADRGSAAPRCSTNSSVVCAISRCSSVSFSGVKTSVAAVSRTARSRLCEARSSRHMSSSSDPELADLRSALRITQDSRCDSSQIRKIVSVSRCLSGVDPPCLQPFEDPGGAHAATDAHRHQPVPRLRGAASRRAASSSALRRCSRADGPSAIAPPLTFSLLRIDRQLTQAGEHLRGERFVQLDRGRCRRASARQLQHLADRRHRPDAEAFRLDAGGGKARRSGPAAAGRAPARSSSDVTITAAAPSLVCDELPAVTRAGHVEGGLELGQRLERRVAPRPFVLRRRSPRGPVRRRRFPASDDLERERRDLVGESAGVDGRERALVTAQRERDPAPRARCRSRARGSRPRDRCSDTRPDRSRRAPGSARSCCRPSAPGSSTRCRRRRPPSAKPHMMRSAA